VKRKIAVLTQHHDKRTDINSLLVNLSSSYDITLFSNFERRDSNFTTKIIKNNKRRVIDKLYLFAFILFGKLPYSKNTYLIIEKVKLNRLKGLKKIIKLIMLNIRVFTPNFMSSNFLAEKISHINQNDLSEFEHILFISDISDRFFASNAIRNHKSVFCYVYSWDHPCKNDFLPSNKIRYFVWNESVKLDLISLQGICGQDIYTVGSTQLCNLKKYINYNENNIISYDFDYIYYTCSVGEAVLAISEIELIILISKKLLNHNKNIKLVVRIYPFVENISIYNRLKDQDNIVIDDGYIVNKYDEYTNAKDRYNKIKNSLSIMHTGTTLGLEAAYFEKPVVFIALNNYNQLDDKIKNIVKKLELFTNQYQLEQYMKSKFENVILNINDIDVIIKKISHNKLDNKYSESISKLTKLESMDSISNNIVKVLSLNG
jgi:hypothetical protein